MSATNTNSDPLTNQGEFHSSVAPSEPLTRTGHQPGKLTSPADHAPEFHAQTLPAGTAPPSRTFAPNPTDDTPTTNIDHASSAKDIDPEAERLSAADSLTGATSADVHTGLGHPGQGQTSSELHQAVKPHGTGFVGVRGSTGLVDEAKLVDPRLPEHADQRALDSDVARGGERGTVGGLAANEMEPESTDTIAREAPRG